MKEKDRSKICRAYFAAVFFESEEKKHLDPGGQHREMVRKY